MDEKRYMDSLLPLEILGLVLENLEMHDLLSCSLVCRRFNFLVDSSLACQYALTLSRAGAVDNIYSKLPTSQKLERLKASELAWSYLNPARRDRIDIPRRFGSFDLCGGVILGARAPSDVPEDAYIASPESEEVDMNACELLGTTMPSVISGDEDIRVWSRNVGFPVYGLGIDAAQDLAIVLQCRTHTDHPFRIHLLQLSTFEPHPLALEATVTHHAPIPVAQISVRCLGSLVGVIFHSIEADNVEQTLIIVNWQTGETKACIESQKEGRTFDDFGFLSSDTVVLPVRKPGPVTLDVYKFDMRSVARRSSRLNRGSPPPAVRIASFRFPPMKEPLEVSVNPICCNSEPPLPPAAMYSSSSSSSFRTPPFYQDGANSIICFSFMVCHGHSAQSTTPLHERFTLVIQRKGFMEQVEDLLKCTAGRWIGHQWRPVVVPWDQWGPSISRWLTMKHMSWACFMSGSRLILSPIIPEDRASCHLRVLDFNPYAVGAERQRRKDLGSQMGSHGYCEEARGPRWKFPGKRSQAEKVSEGDEGEWAAARNPPESRVLVKLVSDEVKLPAGKLWADSVRSWLPYRQVTTKEAFPYANVVIDEERIGGILINEAGDLTEVEILTM